MSEPELWRKADDAAEALYSALSSLVEQTERAERERERAMELAAKLIYDEMRANDPVGKDRPWVARGNSQMQDEARRIARAALIEAPTELLDLPITGKFACQYLSVRTASNLANRFRLAVAHPGKPTIGEILAASDEDLLRTPNIGPVGVEEVHRLRAALAAPTEEQTTHG